jgi:hypothetical protein
MTRPRWMLADWLACRGQAPAALSLARALRESLLAGGEQATPDAVLLVARELERSASAIRMAAESSLAAHAKGGTQ